MQNWQRRFVYIQHVELKEIKMNLLPKSSEDFATKEYWNKFFQKRGRLAFDW